MSKVSELKEVSRVMDAIEDYVAVIARYRGTPYDEWAQKTSQSLLQSQRYLAHMQHALVKEAEV